MQNNLKVKVKDGGIGRWHRKSGSGFSEDAEQNIIAFHGCWKRRSGRTKLIVMQPYYSENGITIYHGDCREVIPSLSGVHLVATDPPYNGVLADEWDNQWKGDADFLEWLDSVFAQLEKVITDNATLYSFSSPRLAARLEMCIARRFRVIGNAVWDKGSDRNGAAGSGIDLSALRTYWTANTERVVISEKMNGEDTAKDASGFWSSCEGAKRSIIGDYLKDEFTRAGITNGAVAALFPSRTGGMTGCVSNWLLGFNLPTREQYLTIRLFLNTRNGGDYLRREYEDLRRPFFLTAAEQWGDVWRFGLERTRYHPAQKPLPLMKQIIRVSSRQGDTVLDPFMGSGTTLRAAKDLGRRAIGIETSEEYCEFAASRLAQGALAFNTPAATVGCKREPSEVLISSP